MIDETVITVVVRYLDEWKLLAVEPLRPRPHCTPNATARGLRGFTGPIVPLA